MNNEMGIYISKLEDPDLYNATLEEAQRLLTISEEIRVTVKKVLADIKYKAENKIVEIKSYTKSSEKQSGFCIRTGTAIPFNQKHPMCDTAYQSWKKFRNPDYPEKFCHFSKELSNGETTFLKPVLKKNWNKAKEIHHL